MKIDTNISVEVFNEFDLRVASDSKTLKSFASSESKVEDLVISQIQRFLKTKGIDEPRLIIESQLIAYEFNYSSLECIFKKDNYRYEVFVRVEGNGSKIAFCNYWKPVRANKRDMISSFILEDTIEKIKQDMQYDDYSFLASIICGVGFTQINRLSNQDLENEYNAILDEREA